MSADLTGSHLDAATGRDEVADPTDRKDKDSDDDDDDDDKNGAGARAARQARAVKGGQANNAEGVEGTGADTGSASGSGVVVSAAAVAAVARGGGGGNAEKEKLDGEVKEMERNKLVRTFFRGLLKEWEMDLNARQDHVKRTVQGKLETKTQKQAKDYMRPLFKLCKQKVRRRALSRV